MTVISKAYIDNAIKANHAMHKGRIRRADIRGLEYLNVNKIVECAEGQVFYELPKSYEIWQESVSLPFRVIRINRKAIGFVHTY